MLRITRQTDYGVILLTHLAAHSGEVYNAPELAADAGIPLPMAGKVLKTLTRAGILHSHRGATGGYSLARPPAEISVAQILTALEGPIALTECIALGPGECDQEVGCPTRGNWQRINLAVHQALEGVSLADMTRPAARQPGFRRSIPLELRLPVLGTVGPEEH
jgi:FeS assembly SUF system regulator